MTQSWVSKFFFLDPWVLKCPVGEAPVLRVQDIAGYQRLAKGLCKVILLSVVMYHEGIVNSVLRSMFNHGIKAH